MPSYISVSSSSLEGTWNGVRRSWGHSLHKTCSRTGSFPPSLARYFIERFSEPRSRVLDPFSGKGTAPLEACASGRVGIGNDVSPEAYVLTHAKVKPVPLWIISDYLDKIKPMLDSYTAESDSVGSDVRLFYHNETLKQIVALSTILKDDRSDEAFFAKALMCGIIHGASKISLSLSCSHSFSMAPAYVRRYATEHRLRRPKRNVIECLKIKAKDVLHDEIPRIRGEAYDSDAIKLPLENESIDLIVTSPPYFNKQTYAWDNWLRLWFLGFNYKEVRKDLFQSGKKDEFVEFMTASLEEMYRVLKQNSACFVVVGDVVLDGKPINTARLLLRPAESAGFDLERIINDEIPKNEKYFMFIPSGKGVRKDRILQLRKGQVTERKVTLPWKIPAA